MEDGQERFKVEIRRVLLPLFCRIPLRRQEHFVNVIAQILDLELARRAKGVRHSKVQGMGQPRSFDSEPNFEAFL